MHAEEMDVGALLAYAYNFIRTVEITWLDAPFESKIKLQRLIFPLGVEYANGQFSNPKLSPLFKLIEIFATENVSLVRAAGFEPTTKGLRVPCSTTELRPRGLNTS